MADSFAQGGLSPSVVAARPGAGAAGSRQRSSEPRLRPDCATLARRLAVADLAEGLAHDLKNQLTVVAASVQLARGPGGEMPASALLDKAFEAAMRAARLLDEMLSYTRSTAAPRQAEADACEAMETAVAGAWSHCSARRVVVEFQAASGLPAVNAPAAALRVLLWRVLCYMAEAVSPGVRLVVGADPGEGSVVVWVRACDSDTAADGTGVADADAHEGAFRVLPALGDEPRGPHGAWPADPTDSEDSAERAVSGRGEHQPARVGGLVAGGGVEPDELSLIQALAAQAGAELRWGAAGPSLFLEAVPS